MIPTDCLKLSSTTFTFCNTKYRANIGAFFMGNLDFDAWSDTTDGDTNNDSLDSGLMGSGY